ncbi:hypothetical protein CEXT_694341 [Caerostris extrusa]|uniref:Uncharacterized protein n=1 Tax=Caerostris extrusa TaxID=172846 RepID=A0AAV4Y2I1_CAEEX|nr:hypothetical protein CEXT_694341 [Caerostris extrusa]
MLEFQTVPFLLELIIALYGGIATVTDVRTADVSIFTGSIGNTLDDDSASVINDVGIPDGDILSDIAGNSLDGSVSTVINVEIPAGIISYGAYEVSLLISGLQIVVFS